MNEIEKQFFDTFEIEPKYYCSSEYISEVMLENECTGGNLEKCKTCEKVGRTYPQITDHILLQLICIALNTFEHFEVNRVTNINTLREKILKLLILAEDDVYSEVQALFKEVNNGKTFISNEMH